MATRTLGCRFDILPAIATTGRRCLRGINITSWRASNQNFPIDSYWLRHITCLFFKLLLSQPSSCFDLPCVGYAAVRSDQKLSPTWLPSSNNWKPVCTEKNSWKASQRKAGSKEKMKKYFVTLFFIQWLGHKLRLDSSWSIFGRADPTQKDPLDQFSSCPTKLIDSLSGGVPLNS